MSYRLRPQAETDIEAIVLYIAEDNPSAARRVHNELYRRCQQIGEMPGIGIDRSAVRPGLRSVPVGNYLILYQQTDNGVEIVRVVHGARQWENLL